MSNRVKSVIFLHELRSYADLLGHEGPVFEVAWGHPKFGNILASCSFDNRIIIWQEQQDGSWQHVFFSILQSQLTQAITFS